MGKLANGLETGANDRNTLRLKIRGSYWYSFALTGQYVLTHEQTLSPERLPIDSGATEKTQYSTEF